MVDGEEELTYAAWNEQANRLADALAPLDGRRAAVRSHQCLEWFVIRLALAKLGWETVAVNWRLTPYETLGILRDSEPSVLFFDDEDDASLQQCAVQAQVRPVSLRNGEFAKLLASGAATSRMSDPMAPMVTYSSGTTGRPKGSRKRPPADAEHLRTIEEYVAPSVKRAREPSRTLLTLPLHHGAGPRSARTCHEIGGTVYLLDRYDPIRALALIQRHRITHWKVVPAMLQRIRALPDATQRSFDVSSLRAISVGSAPTPWALKEWALDYFGPILHEGYGASEIGMAAVMRPDGHRRRPGSCGKLRPHVEARTVGRDGAALPPGAEGELEIRTPITITGYLGEGNADDDCITEDGYFRTGDVGRLDDDGYLYITGRVKDLIIAGGVNIAPVEVEQALSEHPAVLEAAVVGRAEPVFGEQVVAFCELRPGRSVTEAELMSFVEPRLAPFKRPRRIEFLTELPRNALGKVRKDVLREPPP